MSTITVWILVLAANEFSRAYGVSSFGPQFSEAKECQAVLYAIKKNINAVNGICVQAKIVVRP